VGTSEGPANDSEHSRLGHIPDGAGEDLGEDAPQGAADPTVNRPRRSTARVVPDVVGSPSRAAAEPWRLGIPAAGQPAELTLPPDTVLDGGWVAQPEGQQSSAGCEVRLVSARGASHRCYAELRQDHAAVHTIDGWVLAAVADGAGSQPLSHVGAGLAVDVVLEKLAAIVQRA